MYDCKSTVAYGEIQHWFCEHWRWDKGRGTERPHFFRMRLPDARAACFSMSDKAMMWDWTVVVLSALIPVSNSAPEWGGACRFW